MRYKQDPPALKKAEERFGDLDYDEEHGEDPDHQKKVREAEKRMAKGKKALPPAFVQNAKGTKGKGPAHLGGDIPSGGLKPSKGKGKAKTQMCPDCIKAGAKSCSH